MKIANNLIRKNSNIKTPSKSQWWKCSARRATASPVEQSSIAEMDAIEYRPAGAGRIPAGGRGSKRCFCPDKPDGELLRWRANERCWWWPKVAASCSLHRINPTEADSALHLFPPG